jgi:hypothetical protein
LPVLIGAPKLKNFEVNESLNYIVISTSYNVATYACVMSCCFAATNPDYDAASATEPPAAIGAGVCPP